MFQSGSSIFQKEMVSLNEVAEGFKGVDDTEQFVSHKETI